jgi:outer membrane immunogenic protein
MNRVVVAFALVSLAAAGQSLAADFPPPIGAAPVPPSNYGIVPSGRSWAGFYLGANGGYGINTSQWSLNGNPSSAFSPNGFLAGGTVGFNLPISEVVVGFEADADWANFDGSTTCLVSPAGGTAACETKNSFLGTARFRAGYQFGRALPYVTGGLAFGNVQTGLTPPATFDSAVKVGWVAGAGIEYAFFDNWSAKAEYLFVGLNGVTCSTVTNCGPAAGAAVTLNENLIRAGLNYRFSW